MLWTIKYRLSSIMVYFTFTVPELWPFSSQKIGTFIPRSTRVGGIQGSSCSSVGPSITLGFRIIFKVPLNQIFSNFHTLLCSIKYRLSLITVHELWPFFSLENRDFLGFRMIFKVWLNQIFSNFNTMLWTIKYRLSSITVYFIYTVPELWPFFSQKIGTFQVSG